MLRKRCKSLRFGLLSAFSFLTMMLVYNLSMRMHLKQPASSPLEMFVQEPPGCLLENSLPAFDRPSLPFADRSRLVDRTDFRFLIKGPVCNNEDQLVIVLVHSDLKNSDRREAIRKTWGSQLKVLFLLGFKQARQDKITAESKAHHDIVQGNFEDAYRNLTYKHVMGLKWIYYYCPSAKFILKTDDDVFVNPSPLTHYIRSTFGRYTYRLIQCQYNLQEPVQRSNLSKWYVPFSEYPESRYPPFCEGWSILYSRDMVFHLYLMAQSAKYFGIDDVFVTGFLTADSKITRCAFGDVILTLERMEQLRNKGPHEDFFILGPPDISINYIYHLWKIVAAWGEPRVTID